jgi:hypothetical protein
MGLEVVHYETRIRLKTSDGERVFGWERVSAEKATLLAKPSGGAASWEVRRVRITVETEPLE